MNTLHDTPDMLINPYRFGAGSPPSGFDPLVGAARAYSLVHLGASYTGVVCEVRRVSDGVLADFTPTELSDGTLATWLGGADGKIRTLYDQSGNAAHATSLSAVNQPTIMTAGVLATLAGLPVISLVGGVVDGFTCAAHTCQWLYLAFEHRLTENQGIIRADTSANDDIFLSSTTLSVDGDGTDQSSYALNGAALSSSAENHAWSLSLSTRYLLANRMTTGTIANASVLFHVRSGVSAFEGQVQAIITYATDVIADDDDIRAALNTIFAIY